MSAADKLAHAEEITGTLDDLVANAHDLTHDIGDALAEIYKANRRGDLRGQLDGVCDILRAVEKARKELEEALADAMFESYCLAEDFDEKAAAEEAREHEALLREYWAGVRM